MPTPNAYRVHSGDTRLLLDCGASSGGNAPDFGSVSACVVTHAHWDHCGGLVSLVESGVPLYATAATARFISSALQPAIKEDRARAIQDTIIAQKFHTPFEIDDLRITLLPSGHIEGAAMVRVEGDRSLLYTGDLCLHPLLSCEPIASFEPVDTVIVETTLTNYRVPEGDIATERDALTTLEGGLLVGRRIGDLQEARAVLDDADRPYVVHQNVDPAGIDQTEAAHRIAAGELVLVAGSLDHDTASWKLAEPLLPDPERRIILLNGVAQTGFGRKLIGSQRRSNIRVRTRNVRLRARVSALSLRQHPSREELAEWLGEAAQGSHVVLVHGPQTGQYALSRLLRKHGLKVTTPSDGAVIAL